MRDLAKKNIFIIILIVLLIMSVSTNIYQFLYSLETYRQFKKFKIDPSSSLQYHQLNADTPNKTSGTQRIVLFGDSRIYQWNPVPQIPGCEFINRGVPGETTSQAILRIGSDLVQLNPDIVIIQTGGNDCNSIGALPEMESYIITNCKKNIDSLIRELRKHKIKAAFLSVFPFGSVDMYRWPVWSERTRNAITEINRHIEKYDSENIRYIDCDKIFLDDNKIKKKFSRDMLHINKAGYERLNDLISPVLKKLLDDKKE